MILMNVNKLKKYNRFDLLTALDNTKLFIRLKTYVYCNFLIKLIDFGLSDTDIIKLSKNYINLSVREKCSVSLDSKILVYGLELGTKIYNDYVVNNIKSSKNTYKNGRKPKFDHFFKEYWVNRGFSEEESINIVNDRKTRAKNNSIITCKNTIDRTITQQMYWINKGFTQEESIDIIKINQATGTLKRFITKYGTDEGIKRFNDKNIKWLNTLNNKSFEEKQRIYDLRCAGFKLASNKSISKQETNVLDELEESFNIKIDRQVVLKSDSKNYIYDGVYNNIIIEFNGDFWHCNPIKYSSDYYHPIKKIYARDIWKFDEVKLNAVKDKFNIFIIWESELKDVDRIRERFRLLL